jgi:glycine cleavage system H lipoate-binding protein
MFPFVYEFHWTPGHIIFLGIFFTVLVLIAATFIKAMFRSQKDFRLKKSGEILWHSDFEDLPKYARVCRHELTGEVEHRVCENAFNCGACEAHKTFSQRDFQLAQQKPEINSNITQAEVFGFTMPTDRMYHRGHTWVKKSDDGTYLVGIDDFGNRLIGKPDAVSLPEIGSHIEANTPGFTLQKAGAHLRVLSPMSGEVIEHGKKENDWYLKVKADDDMNAHLLRGAEIRPWIMREMERLQMSLATTKIGFTLADGGELVPDMNRHYPNVDWDGIWGEMFLEA